MERDCVTVGIPDIERLQTERGWPLRKTQVPRFDAAKLAAKSVHLLQELVNEQIVVNLEG